MENLQILLTDYVKCGAEWSWNSDANGWKGFHIWCVNEGGARIREQNNTYDLLPGDIFLFDLSSTHICTHNPLRPLAVTTVYFTCDTDRRGSRLIRQNPFLFQAIQQGVRYSRSSCRKQGLLWLNAAVYEIFHLPDPLHAVPEAVATVCRRIEEAFPLTPSLGQLAREAGYSKNQLMRLFRQYLGTTPIQYILQKKMEYAKGMLLYSNLSITEIAYHTGYTDIAYFTKTFKKLNGCTPTEYRKIL